MITIAAAVLLVLLTAALAEDGPAHAQTTCAAPTLPANQTLVWSATMTVGISGTSSGYFQDGVVGSLTPSAFDFQGTGHRVRASNVSASGTFIVRFGLSGTADQNLRLPAENFVLRVGSATFNFHGHNSFVSFNNAYVFRNAGLNWSSGQTVCISLAHEERDQVAHCTSCVHCAT